MEVLPCFFQTIEAQDMVLRRCMLLRFISRCFAALSVHKLFTDFTLGLAKCRNSKVT
jgi:hypothetical protein